MRELNSREMESVSGGWVPVFIGAAHLTRMAISNPAVRSAAANSVRYVADNFAKGGIGAAGGGAYVAITSRD